MLINSLSKQKFVDMVDKLKRAMKPEGFWPFVMSTLTIYGISQEFFEQSAPVHLRKNRKSDCFTVWLTMNTYCLICIF
jgi:hypothetical protein